MSRLEELTQENWNLAIENKQLGEALQSYDKKVGELEGLVKELSDKLKEREWQPIETAPKDGTKIQVTRNYMSAAFAAYEKTDCLRSPDWIVYTWCDGWQMEGTNDGYPVTFNAVHWMPIVTLPSIPRGDSK